MNKRKILTLAVVAVIAITAVAGASLAYFTDTDTAENTLTMGSVKIKLDEAAVDAYGCETDDGTRVEGGNEYGIDAVYPGAVIAKDPTVHNVGKNGAYIRATVNISDWMNICAALYPDFKATFPSDDYKLSLQLLVGQLGDGWSVVGVETGDTFEEGRFDAKFVLKYDGILASGADTTPIFKTVTVPTGITNESASCLSEIKVVAHAIQHNSFDTWEKAFAAFDAE